MFKKIISWFKTEEKVPHRTPVTPPKKVEYINITIRATNHAKKHSTDARGNK